MILSLRYRSSTRRRLVSALALVAMSTSLLPAEAAAQGAPAVRPVALETAPTLRGLVSDATGLPLLGAFVAVMELGADRPAAIVVTDARGTFEVEALRPGVYSLLVGSLGFAGRVVQGVNVPTAQPVNLQLEPDNERSLASMDAPLNLSWALRSRKRDILRQTEAVVVDAGSGVPAGTALDWATPADAESTASGELHLWSFTSMADHETVGVTSLSLGNPFYDDWSFRAHAGDGGAIWARGEITHDFENDHRLDVGFGYVGSNLPLLVETGGSDHDNWIGSLTAYDTWQATRPLQVSFGIRYEHHNYMGDSQLISPGVRLDYRPDERTRLFTGVEYDSEGLDLAQTDDGFEISSLIGTQNLRIDNLNQITPERAMRYEIGIERSIGDTEVSVQAYYDDVTDELVGVYVAGPAGSSDFILFNVGDNVVRGFELTVAGELFDAISGGLRYAYENREQPYRSEVVANGFGESSGEFDGHTFGDVHEVQAELGTVLSGLQTQLVATYNWKQGMPVLADGEMRDDYGRFDLRLRQPLPFRVLSSDWSAMVHFRNVLGPDYDGLFNVSLSELTGLTRGIAGGLALKF